jgi:hypothetical protein
MLEQSKPIFRKTIASLLHVLFGHSEWMTFQTGIAPQNDFGVGFREFRETALENPLPRAHRFCCWQIPEPHGSGIQSRVGHVWDQNQRCESERPSQADV